MRNFHHSKVLGPFDIGSGNPTTNQTSTQQNIGSQSSGGNVRIRGGVSVSNQGVGISGNKNQIQRQVSVGRGGANIQGNKNTTLTIGDTKGNVNVSNTVTGVSGDDLDSIIHDLSHVTEASQQDFSRFASNALSTLTPPTSQGVSPVAPTPPAPVAPTGFLDNLAAQIGITTNELMLALAAIAFAISLYFIRHK